jgi:methylmalonyl-CoA mutase
VESLTDALARAAWQRFRELEAGGGLLAGLRAGSIQADIERAATRLRERAATRKLPLTGLSSYPTLDDPPTPEQPPNQPAQREAGPELPAPDGQQVTPLQRLRLAEPFERLRDAAQRLATRPRIYACNLGPLAAHQARLEFASNSFSAGGLELMPSEGFSLDDPDALLDAVTEGMRASGCALAIVCGRDQDYTRFAAEVIVALRTGGAKAVWIAGRPPNPSAESWGLDPELPPRFVYLGADVLLELELALSQLEVG